MNLPGFPSRGSLAACGHMEQPEGQISFFMVMAPWPAGRTSRKLDFIWNRTDGRDLFLDRYLRTFFPNLSRLSKELRTAQDQGGSRNIHQQADSMIPYHYLSIPAGVIRMNFIKYTISSSPGHFVWNFFLIGAGYVMRRPCVFS